MTSTMKYALLAGVLGLAALAGETRFQYQQERAALAESRAFYDCCGLSRLELIKAKAVARIVLNNPRSADASEAGKQLVKAWVMATSASKAQVLRPAMNQVFRGYGQRAEQLMRSINMTQKDLQALEYTFSESDTSSGQNALLSSRQTQQLAGLRSKSHELGSLTINTLVDFSSIAMKSGYPDQRTLFTGVQYNGPWMLGRLAVCIVEPELVEGGKTEEASFAGCMHL